MEFFKNINKKTKIFIILNIAIGIIYLIFQILITSQYMKSAPLSLTFFDFLILFSYFFISLFCLKKLVAVNTVHEKLQKSEDYNKSLKDMNDNFRCFKHDYNNTVTTISGYLQNNDLSGLKTYFNKLENDCIAVNTLGTLDPNVINNPGIYHLISSKYYQAIDDGIQVSISFFLDLKELNMDIYEFAKILGILLDNAIEACSQVKPSSRERAVTLKLARSWDVFFITCKNPMVPNKIRKSGSNFLSTKVGDGISGHGFGISNIRKIVDAAKGQCSFTPSSDEFVVEIALPFNTH